MGATNRLRTKGWQKVEPVECRSCWAHRRTEWYVLNKAGLSQLDRGRKTRDYRPGETLFHQDEVPAGLFCLQSGQVLLRRIDAFGIETAFQLVTQGETLGWRSLFAEQMHVATAVCLSACRVCFVPKEAVESLIDQQPQLAIRFLRTLARDRGPSEALLLRSPQLPVNIRVLHFLITLMDRCATSVPPEGLEYEIPLKRKDIAAMVGTRYETLSRAIKQVEAEGIAHFDRQRVRVPSIRRLFEAARQAMPEETFR